MQELNLNNTYNGTLGFHITNTFSIFISMEKINDKLKYNNDEVKYFEKESFKFNNQSSLTKGKIKYFSKLRNLVTLEHEIKHFNDLFLTPFGVYCIVHEFNMLLNLPTFLSLYNDSNGFEVKLPFFKSLKEKEKIDITQIELLEKKSQEINELYNFKNTFDMTSIDIIECLATCAEFQSLYLYFGQNTVDFYLNFMLEQSDTYTHYVKAIKFIILTLNIREINKIHTILYYCLCGDYHNEGKNAFPSKRFEDLVLHFHNNKDKKLSFEAILNNFYTKNNYKIPKQAIQDCQKIQNESINRFKDKFNDINDNQQKSMNGIFELYDEYFSKRNEIINKKDFFTNYSNLSNYMKHKHIYPNIYYYSPISEKNKVISIEINEILKKEFKIELHNNNYPILLKKKNIPTFNKLQESNSVLYYAFILNISRLNSIEKIKNNDLTFLIAEYLKNNFRVTFVE